MKQLIALMAMALLAMTAVSACGHGKGEHSMAGVEEITAGVNEPVFAQASMSVPATEPVAERIDASFIDWLLNLFA